MKFLHLTKYYMLLAIFLLTMIFHSHGQQKADLEKIAASQGAASPLLYTLEKKEISVIQPGDFYNEQECIVRNGISNFYSKIEEGKEITIAFIGGSITQGEYCYRLQISQYIEKLYPNISFKWVNAGVSGTGTDFGSFRIDEQVLQYNPDLVFIEFAVNGGYPDGMEGMLRKIIKKNPYIDICLIYTIYNGQTAAYARNEVPQTIKILDSLATHYKVPSIHLGMEAAQLEKEQKLLWKGQKEEAQGKILFSHDGVHPIAEGGNLYAAAMARGLEKMRRSKQNPAKHTLPATPFKDDKWEQAGMYLPSKIALFDEQWKEIQTHEQPHLQKFSPWFNTLMTSDQPGASFSFAFEGDMFGLFDIGGPEVGQLEIFVDGERVKLNKVNIVGTHLFQADKQKGESYLSRFNKHCNNRYRGQYDVIKLEKGIHYVTIRISSQKEDKKTIVDGEIKDITENPDKYNRSVLYLGRILLCGKPIIHPSVKEAQRQKWEQKIQRYEKQDYLDPPGKDHILFLGSSTIENWKTLSTDFPDVEILNRGVSGTKTIDQLHYKERLISPYQPKKIFIYQGDNDIGYKWLPENILSQFKELFFFIREEKPEAEIIFISIKPSPRRLKNTEEIIQTNALIKEFIEQQPNAAYADVYHAMFSDTNELYPEHFIEDGLHLTAEGYEVWKKVISEFIK